MTCIIELKDDFELQWSEYWEIVETGRQNRDDMKAEIQALNEHQLADFYWISLTFINMLENYGKTQELVKQHSQAYVDEIANWAILQGSDYFDAICYGDIAFPSILPADADNFNVANYTEGLYKKRYGKAVVFRPGSYGGSRLASSEPSYDTLPEQDETWKWFWTIIETSKGHEDNLETKMELLTKEELIRFYHTTRKLGGHFADHAEYTDDAKVDISDDTLDVLSDWVIRQGEEYYVDVRKNPKKFPKKWLEPSNDVTLWIMAHNEYSKRYDEDVPDSVN